MYMLRNFDFTYKVQVHTIDNITRQVKTTDRNNEHTKICFRGTDNHPTALHYNLLIVQFIATD